MGIGGRAISGLISDGSAVRAIELVKIAASVKLRLQQPQRSQ